MVSKKEENLQASLEKIIKILVYYFLIKTMSFLTRFPVFEDFFQEKIFHHKNHCLLVVVNVLEGKDNPKLVYITRIDKYEYYTKFSLQILSKQSLKKLEKSLVKKLKKVFGFESENIIIRLKNKPPHILVPTEILK